MIGVRVRAPRVGVRAGVPPTRSTPTQSLEDTMYSTETNTPAVRIDGTELTRDALLQRRPLESGAPDSFTLALIVAGLRAESDGNEGGVPRLFRSYSKHAGYRFPSTEYRVPVGYTRANGEFVRVGETFVDITDARLREVARWYA